MATIKFTLKPGECRTVAGRRFCNRWKPRTAAATEEYIRGVKDPKKPWGKCTCDAADNYKAGVDKAHARGAVQKGVKRRGSAGWKTKTLLKGPTRFAEGVHTGADAYARGYKPFHTHFPSIRLPKRFPRGDPRNIKRCSAVTSAFGMVKAHQSEAGDLICPED